MQHASLALMTINPVAGLPKAPMHKSVITLSHSRSLKSRAAQSLVLFITSVLIAVACTG
jgi:hypothetical protein